MTSSVAGFTALQVHEICYLMKILTMTRAYLITSAESQDGTNSLLMKRPVGTVMVLLSSWTLAIAGGVIVESR